MISDGIENCLQYIDNFDPKKSKNPFAYFTQIIYFAFIRRIQKEKRYMYTKYKAIEHANQTNAVSQQADGDIQQGVTHQSKVQYGEWSEDKMHDFIHEFETTKRKIRVKHRHDDKIHA
jgi:DNA-directed RNA polymerase specialized sigma24 family protein